MFSTEQLEYTWTGRNQEHRAELCKGIRDRVQRGEGTRLCYTHLTFYPPYCRMFFQTVVPESMHYEIVFVNMETVQEKRILALLNHKTERL
jgi:hypothetical protein